MSNPPFIPPSPRPEDDPLATFEWPPSVDRILRERLEAATQYLAVELSGAILRTSRQTLGLNTNDPSESVQRRIQAINRSCRILVPAVSLMVAEALRTAFSNEPLPAPGGVEDDPEPEESHP